jgi:hypothetical protein
LPAIRALQQTAVILITRAYVFGAGQIAGFNERLAARPTWLLANHETKAAPLCKTVLDHC